MCMCVPVGGVCRHFGVQDLILFVLYTRTHTHTQHDTIAPFVRSDTPGGMEEGKVGVGAEERSRGRSMIRMIRVVSRKLESE